MSKYKEIKFNMLMVSATEMKNNFGKYLKLLETEGEIVITQYGKEVARLMSKEANRKFLIDDLRGVLKGTNYTAEDAKEERTKRAREYLEKITHEDND